LPKTKMTRTKKFND